MQDELNITHSGITAYHGNCPRCGHGNYKGDRLYWSATLENWVCEGCAKGTETSDEPVRSADYQRECDGEKYRPGGQFGPR